MKPEQFKNHKQDNPHLTFEFKESKLIPIEQSYNDTHGTYNIFRRQTYLKSNSKTCYVDYFIKSVIVERSKLIPCKNGFSFRIKNKFIEEIIKD